MPLVSMVVRHLLNREGTAVVDQVLHDWIIEFMSLLEVNGLDLVVWQEGQGWSTMLPGGGQVCAVPEPNPHSYSLPNVNQVMRERSADISLAVYADPLFVYPQAHDMSITLGHSIPFPGKLADNSTEQERLEWIERIKLGLSSVNYVVTNNTQYIQWAASTWPGLSHKMKYIPDWFESERSIGIVPDSTARSGEKIRIVFSCPAVPRFGISETLRSVSALLDQYPQLGFCFCGALPASIEKHMQKWMDEHLRSEMNYEEQAAYRYMDVALFPIKSGPVPVKSVIQAMGAGAVVIGSMWGPLVDLIIPDYNGLLIKPLDTDIIKAVQRLIENPGLRENLADKAQQTRKSFRKCAWESGWQSLIEELVRGKNND